MSLSSGQPRLPSLALAKKRTKGSFRLVGLAIFIGVVTGLMVVAVQELVPFLQRAFLGFAAERRVALPNHASWLRIFLSLAVGGVAITFVYRWLMHFAKREPIDAVEANALWGGNMTWLDAAAVVIPILISVSCGASVGIEAAVTQLGAVLASKLAVRRGLLRTDRRLMVGAGAAAAIAAAYRAPIAGVFYAFELVLGNYSKRTLAPIGLAAIAATMTIWAFEGPQKSFSLFENAHVGWTDYPLAVVLGFLSAFTGVAVMLLATSFERRLKAWIKDESLRRVAVSGLLTVLATRFPAVLGSGHAAVESAANGGISKGEALGLLGAKVVASAGSLGSGFRGGLFSASLLLGALLGQTVAWGLGAIPGLPEVQPGLCALIGMAAVGAAVIGAPLTMIFLAIETTGDFDAGVVVAIGAMTASFLTDRLFGYSFATWRFQQRGLALEGGQDVARLASTPITDLIRPPKRTVPANASLGAVMRAISFAGARGTAVITQDGEYLGLVDPALVEAFDQEEGPLPVVAAELVQTEPGRVTPSSTLAEVIDLLRSSDKATLSVLDPKDSRKLIGCIRGRDAFALASSLVEEQRRDDLGVPS